MSNIMDIINVPLGYIIKFCYMIIPNYAFALLLFAIIVKAALLPLGIKQQKNMIMQARLRPKEAAIRKRYAGRDDKPTQQKMQEEVLDLYKKENYNPAGGCLPLLVQLPIIYALYYVVRSPLTYISRIGDHISAIVDKLASLQIITDAEKLAVSKNEIHLIELIKNNFASLTDVLPSGFKLSSIPSFTIFGGHLDLSKTPEVTNLSWLLLIPVLTFIFSFLSMRITRKFTYQPPQQEGNAALSSKIMDFTMPLFSVWITFTVPALLGVYWIYQSLLSAAQQVVLAKLYPIPVFTDDDFKKAEKEMNGSVRREKKPKTRSLHHIDDDETPPQKENTPQPQQPKKEEGGSMIAKAPLKDGGNAPAEKNKPKVRSLHRIDEEDGAPSDDSGSEKADKADKK